jgi:transposase
LLADKRVRKSKSEIADALQGNYQDELMYELKQCYEIYKTFQKYIQDCDEKIETTLKDLTKHVELERVTTKKQLKGKNQQRFDLPAYS